MTVPIYTVLQSALTLWMSRVALTSFSSEPESVMALMEKFFFGQIGIGCDARAGGQE
jgi:hypothetical protein